jgi:hypothetical protein
LPKSTAGYFNEKNDQQHIASIAHNEENLQHGKLIEVAQPATIRRDGPIINKLFVFKTLAKD